MRDASADVRCYIVWGERRGHDSNRMQTKNQKTQKKKKLTFYVMAVGAVSVRVYSSTVMVVESCVVTFAVLAAIIGTRAAACADATSARAARARRGTLRLIMLIRRAVCERFWISFMET
jgi:ribose 5-phosphate isomerase RpiB